MGRNVRDLTERIAPGFIAAMPQLADPNFHRTVVLMLRHDDEGAFGLVVNRPGSVALADLLEEQDIPYEGSLDQKIMIGGPVEVDQHLLVLHGELPQPPTDDPDEVPIAEGIFLVTQRTGLERLTASIHNRYRCYVGYAGWAPGQLENELAEGAWVPLAVDAALLFDVPAGAVWERALRRAGIDPVTLVPGGELN